MTRYLNAFRAFVANSLQHELVYRVDFFLNLINVLLGTAASLAIVFIMFTHRAEIGGWSFFEVVILIGIFRLVKCFVDVVIVPNVGRIPELVRKGGLDFILLKPIDSQFLVSLRHLSFWDLSEAIIGTCLVVIGWIAQDAPFTLSQVVMMIVALLTGAGIVYAVWLLLMTTSVWLIDIRNLPVVLRIGFEFAQFPVSAFPRSLRFILTLVVPVAFVTTVPASAVTGRLVWSDMLFGAAVALGLLVAARYFWHYALRHYTGASG